MGRLFIEFLESKSVYVCTQCRTHIADCSELISKRETWKSLLDEHGVNALELEEKILMTGGHKVCDLFCRNCSTLLGWKYEEAYEETEKYKEGKYIVERATVLKRGSSV